MTPRPARPPIARRRLAGALALRAVTFDVGGTLIEPWPSVGHIYATVAARHGCRRLSPTLLNRRFARAWRGLRDFRHTASEWAALVDATFHGLTPVLPSQTFFPELYDRFSQPQAWRVYDDVRPALEALASSGLRLGVISNWDDRLRPLLRRLRLDRYFTAIIVSCEVAAPKPSPIIFQAAAAALALPPSAILHIGDCLPLDVRAAKAAGFRALRLQRRLDRPTDGAIKSLQELLALLEATHRQASVQNQLCFVDPPLPDARIPLLRRRG
jgi:putative hydrolase of the HAD superfamily